MALDLLRPQRSLSVLDDVVARLARAREAASEEDVLTDAWGTGEDVRLHEDARFVPCGGGARWRLATQRLGNDRVVRALLRGAWDGRDAASFLEALDEEHGAWHVLDPDDDRLHRVCDGRWTAVIDALPLRPEPSPGAAEVTSLEAAGGRLEAGQAAEPLGWVTLREPGPPGAFVAQVVGTSMEPRLPDRSWALFAPEAGDGTVALAVVPEGPDSELVAAVVKAVVRDARGRPIGLRSENPAHAGASVLPPGCAWADVRLVARLVRPLGPSDFADLVLPGARAVASGPLGPEALARRLARLSDRRATLMRARDSRRRQGEAQSDEGTSQSSEAGWAPVALVLSADGSSLRLAVPGWELPTEVRYVELGGRRVAARNLLRPQVGPPVQPQHARYAVTGVGGGPDVAARLAACGAAGLPLDRATAFRAPSQGVGERLAADVALRDGRTYRVVVPPSLTDRCEALTAGPWAELLGHLTGPEGEWPVIQLDVPDQGAETLDAALAPLGLTRSAWGLAADLVGPMPRGHTALPSGLVVPTYAASEAPCVFVEASAPCEAHVVHVLVADERGRAQLPLGEGAAWTVALEDLAPGLVIVEVRATDREVDPEQLAFLLEQTASTATGVPASAALRLGAREVLLSSGDDDRPPDAVDLAAALEPAGEEPVLGELQGPPFWRYQVGWGAASLGAHLDVVADEVGKATLPLDELRVLSRAALARVSVDGGELGHRELLHDAPPTVERLLDDLRALHRGMSVPIERLAGPRELAGEWVVPVLRTLGFEPGEPIPSADHVDLPLRRLRPSGRGVRVDEVGLARVVRGAAGLGLSEVTSLRDAESALGAFAGELRRRDARLGVLTDGAAWVRVEALRFAPRAWQADLRAALGDPFDARLLEFVQGFLD